jgi:ACS family hexuronate transporter-like MFS transporter
MTRNRADATTGAQLAAVRGTESPEQGTGVGRYRWRICALLFFATTLNYMDRQALALLKPTLQSPVHGIGMTELQYAGIISVFSAAYAIGLLIAGPFIDRVGTRIGYAVAVSIWAIAAMAHAFVPLHGVAAPLQWAAHTSAGLLEHVPLLHGQHWLDSMGRLSGAVVGFGVVRFFLGLGEAGNFPAAIKATAEWFPKRERALATGIFNSGTNIGATLAPFAIAFILLHLAWNWAFLATSAFAVLWIILWLRMYKSPHLDPYVTRSELVYISSDPPEPATRVPWKSLLPHRQTWAFVVGKVFTDPIWWFYLYWLPGFLNARFGLSIAGMGLPLLVIYNVCTVGSVFGGWLPAKFVSRGWSINRARKTAMLLYALAVVPVVFIDHVHSLWQAVGIISLVTAAHQAWSANLFTLASDMFPRRTVASVVGIGACGGSLSMMVFGTVVGLILQMTHGNYRPVFLLAGTAYLIAIAIIHLLAPRLKTVNLEDHVLAAQIV